MEIISARLPSGLARNYILGEDKIALSTDAELCAGATWLRVVSLTPTANLDGNVRCGELCLNSFLSA